MTTMLTVVLAMVLAMVQVCAAVGAGTSTSTAFLLKSSTFVIKPESNLTNAGGYDYKNNAGRYQALVDARDKSFEGSKQTWTKWAVLNGSKTLLSGKPLVVPSSKQLAFQSTSGSVFNRSRLSVTFKPSSLLLLSRTELYLTNALLHFTHPSTSLLAAETALSLTNSTLKGTMQRFHVSVSILLMAYSAVQLANTPFHLRTAQLTARSSSVTLTRSAPTTPPASAFLSASSFLVSQSSVILNNSRLTLVNITDAFFVQSSLGGGAFTVELVNSNLRFIDCFLEYKSASFKLTNSTLQILGAGPTIDKYLASFDSTLSGKPARVPYPRKAAADVLTGGLVKGTGTLTMVSSQK